MAHWPLPASATEPIGRPYWGWPGFCRQFAVLSILGPDTYDQALADAALEQNKAQKQVTPDGLGALSFDPQSDLIFDYGPALPGHANGLILMATDARREVILQETYYSIGGGFVLTQAELAAGSDNNQGPTSPYPFRNAVQMLEMCAASGLSIAALKANKRIGAHGRSNA